METDKVGVEPESACRQRTRRPTGSSVADRLSKAP